MTEGLNRGPLPWLGALIAVYLAVPLIAFAIRFLGTSNRGFAEPGLFPSLLVSIESATISLALITLFGVPLAYVLARSRGRVAAVVGVVVLLPLALPPLMSGILLIYLVGPYTFAGRLFNGHLTNSLAGIVLAQTFCAAPFLIVSARSAFATVDESLLNVASTLGHSAFSRFRRVALPIAGPGIRAGMLLAWLRAFGEYGAVIVLAYHPFTLPVYTYNQFSGIGLPTTIAPTALALAVAFIAVLLSRLHPWGRVGSPTIVPAADPPLPATPTPVGFELDYRLGQFHLAVAHKPTSRHVAVLGPSGSGKSVLLRSVAGLYGANPGPVSYGTTSVTNVPAEQRQVGYVAQGFSLFPHLTVWQHLLFAKGATAGQAAYWISHLHLEGLQDRHPYELSGGQSQRVGLAQALCRSPDLLLLDEPFSSLDVPVRQELRRELRRLQTQTGVATVLVTHDPEEAAYLADEVIVINDGGALQSGSIREVFSRPASPQVGRLLGMANLHRAVVMAAGLIDTDGVTFEADTFEMAPGTSVLWSVRPEHVALAPSGGLVGYVLDIADIGTAFTFRVNLGPRLELQGRAQEPVTRQPGDPCQVVFAPGAVTVWPSGR